MNYKNYLKDLFECIPDYRKIVLLIYLIQNDDDYFLKECGFLNSDINRLNEDFKTILIEQNEENLEYVEDQEESIIEKILNK